MELLTETVVLTKRDGTPLVKGKDYYLLPKEAGNGFTVKFKQEIDYAVDMTYTTKVKAGYYVDDSGLNVSNTIKSYGKNEAGGTGQADQNGLIKRLTEVNHTTQTADWLIEVNRSGYEMTDWQMTDTFPNKGLILQAETVKVFTEKGEKTPLVNNQDYILTPTNEGFNLKLIGAYNPTTQKLYISYTTAYDKNQLTEKGQPFINRAVATWVDKDGHNKQNSGQDQFSPTPETYNNGSKYGSYNAVTKRITWTVNVNYNRDIIKNGTIVDEIKGNQQFVTDGPVTLETYQVEKDGSMTKIAELPAFKFDKPTRENKQTLTAYLPETSERLVYRLTFQTSLIDQVIGESSDYDNLAIFNQDAKEQDRLTGKVDIKNGGVFATKGGTYDPKKPLKMAWSVYVNESQSTIKDFVLVDQPSANQEIAKETLKVTKLVADEEGNLRASTEELVLDKDYSLDLVSDMETGQEKMTIKFKNTISDAYEISYQANLLLNDGDNTVTNSISVTGNGEEIKTENVSKSYDIYHTDSSGTSNGKVMEFYLKKANDHGQALAGITFNLIDAKTGSVKRTMTTNDEGIIGFKNILSGSYYLQEVTQREGYLRSDALVNGTKLIEIKKGDYPEQAPFEVQNILNEVELFKKDAGGKGLGDAVFSLARAESKTSDYQPLADYQEIRTEAETGRIFIEGLTNGFYRLTEESPAPGYLKNNEVIDFQITGQEKTRLQLPDFINYQGHASFRKTNQLGQGLKGARFSLFTDKLVAVQTNLVSDEEGFVQVTNLEPGNYVLIETEAPTGYILNKTPIKFSVASEALGKPTTIELPALINYQGTAELAKVDAQKEPLADATFSLFTETGELVQADLVSNSNGKIKATGLASGRYYFQETKAAPGYILNTDKYQFEIVAEASSEPIVATTKTATNYQGSAQLVKKDATGERLAGAEFKVETAAGELVVAELVSNSDGLVTVNNLAPGSYFFSETKAPKGYVLNSQKIGFEIVGEHLGKPTVVKTESLTNYQGSAQLKKLSEAGNKLAGAHFKVINSQGQVIAKDLISNQAGLVEITNLSAGDYAFVETQAPIGYILNDTPQTFTIKTSYTGVPVVELAGELVNYQGSVTLNKTDDQGKPLTTAQFNLYQETGELVKENLSTEADGKITVTGLASGAYYFKESQAASGYLLNSEKISFKIVNNATIKPETIQVKAINYQGAASLIKRSETGIVLAGAEFKVVDEADKDVQTGLVSDANGLIMVTNLGPGTYQFVETQAAPGYVLNSETISFTIVSESLGKPLVVEAGEFTNYKGKASLSKTDSVNRGLANAVFKIVNDSQQTVKEQLVSNKKGVVEVTGLAPGTYYFIETQAPSGYMLNETPVKVVIAETTKAKPVFVKAGRLQNYQGSVMLTKTDGAKAILPDAMFNLYTASGLEIAKNLMTNQQGQISVANLAPGSYYFVETKAPKGFVLNTTNINFTVSDVASEEPETIVVSAVNYQGSASLQKMSSDQKALPGAIFDLIDEAETIIQTNLTSNEAGLVKAEKLAPGTYYFVETQAPKGYLKNKQKLAVTIPTSEANQPEIQIAGELINYQGSVEMLKVDQEGQPLAGAVFKLISKDQQNEMGQDLVVQTDLIANELGLVKASHLAPGNYAFVETAAPEDYILNTEERLFTIEAESLEQPQTVTVADFVNYRGKLSFRKTNGSAVPRSIKGLEGAEFRLTKYHLTGRFKEESGIIKADDTGLVSVNNLAPGYYTLTEIKAPTGFITRTKTVEFEIALSGKGDPGYAYNNNDSFVFENYQGTAELTKTTENGTPLEGAVFSIMTEADEEIQSGLVSDQNGIVRGSNLAPGSYYFAETKAAKGYQLNTKKVPFTIAAESETGKSDVTDLTLINYQGQVNLTKLNQSGEVLPDVMFDLYRQEKAEDTLIAKKLVTNEAGLITVNDLAPGTYYFKETKAAKGYILNQAELVFTIAQQHNEQQVIELEMINYQGTVELTKRNEAGDGISGVEFKLTDDKGQVVKEKVMSDDQGIVKVEHLAPGEYSLIEVKAASGYIINTEPVAFTIDATSETGQVNVTQLELINYQGSVELTKTDDSKSAQALAGAEFKLVDGNGQTVVEKLVTDSQGQLKVSSLAPGSYGFVETKAPTGYVLDEELVSFKVPAETAGKPTQIKVAKTNQKVKQVSLLTPTKNNQQKGATKKSQSLPQTNEEQSLLIVIAGIGIIGLALGGYRRQKLG